MVPCEQLAHFQSPTKRDQPMDKVLKYQKALVSFLEDYAKIKPANLSEVENQVIVDSANHHYQLVRVGWENGKHVHYAVFYFDIIGDKVWVQQNRTDLPIGYELMDLSLAESDLVYAYLPASLRAAA
jgi:hypothetical protein